MRGDLTDSPTDISRRSSTIALASRPPRRRALGSRHATRRHAPPRTERRTPERRAGLRRSTAASSDPASDPRPRPRADSSRSRWMRQLPGCAQRTAVPDRQRLESDPNHIKGERRSIVRAQVKCLWRRNVRPAGPLQQRERVPARYTKDLLGFGLHGPRLESSCRLSRWMDHKHAPQSASRWRPR